MVPKKIHYCWFGEGSKTKLFYKCLKSWQKFFPNYEIIEWNENNFDIYYNDYTKEAYSQKKYAFVSDVARLKIIYDEGGIYFDTDVEVLKEFDHKLLDHGFFGEETSGKINTGLGFAAPPKDRAIKKMLDDYQGIHFIKPDGSMDLTPCPDRNSLSLKQASYTIKAGAKINQIPIFSEEYIGGYDCANFHFIVNDRTYAKHHYNASWESHPHKIVLRTKRVISKIVGKKNYVKLKKFKHRIINS